MLEFKNVGLNYYSKNGETVALKDISFKIEEGELVSIVGPSGCGKTTILSLISGLLKPSRGEVKISGNDVAMCQTGYMFQKDHLFDWRTIRKNVLLGLEVQHTLNDETKNHAMNLVEKYGLGEFLDKYPNQLSGGMRQRVALIRTLALNPKVLLLDEPFSALDFQTRLNLCDDVHKILKTEHKTAILVTHDISEAISMSDRIIVLSARPAVVKTIHTITLKNPTPLLRREEPGFSKYFDQIWKELSI